MLKSYLLKVVMAQALSSNNNFSTQSRNVSAVPLEEYLGPFVGYWTPLKESMISTDSL